MVGNYHNQGHQWRKQGTTEKVRGHDFPGPEVPRAYPYGIYDLGRNAGFVNVGTDHDTGAFAVASIRGWWRTEGRRLYPRAERLLITADGGGSLLEIINRLDQEYPGLKERICDESGEIRRFVNLYINGEDVRFFSGLETPVKAGDEVSIVPAVAGG